MGQHDDYGKKVLLAASQECVQLKGNAIEIDYGYGMAARIDGYYNDIAIEIESRVSKQIRGAVLDLIFHRATKKLLIILPVHANNPRTTRDQCEYILSRFSPPEHFRVVLLQGHGNADGQFFNDVKAVETAFAELS